MKQVISWAFAYLAMLVLTIPSSLLAVAMHDLGSSQETHGVIGWHVCVATIVFVAALIAQPLKPEIGRL